ncbi:MAG TPA: biotin--[acetyl-CoA-carboxylase] ligase, partial [Blastocatellia bacterium]|nr:biotin--[acetyl-CoA-carboxylase] ligase [Blastocatellia bacterium]
ILRFNSLPSTNDLARELAGQGALEGVAVLAREQTRGRGRQGRAWASPMGEGLYLSVILRPPVEPARATILTLAAAIAVAETLSFDYVVTSDIKWPNDVHARGRKICGILIESAIERNKLSHAVLGVGVNLGQREFPSELREAATSVLIESGRRVTPDEFAAPLLARLEVWYRTALRQPATIIAQWQALSSYAEGCAVRVTEGGGAIEGITRGLAPSGALVVETPDGVRREIVAGEISLRKR